jgi:integrase
MGRPKAWPPKVKPHEGQDRCYYNGRYHYLGPTGTPEAKARYARLLAKWLLDPGATDRSSDDLLVVELARDFMLSEDSPPGGDQRNRFVRAIELFAELHLSTTVEAFTPMELEAWQSWLCKQVRDGQPRFNRTSVRELVGSIRAIFKWGVRRGKVDEPRYRALLTVPGPKYGTVREPVERQSVAIDVVEATILELRRPTAAMVRVQLLTGARPGEVCAMRVGEIHRAGRVDLPGVGVVDLDELGVWVYVPKRHKNTHRGKTKFVMLGPKCQAVLLPFLDCSPDAFLFDPREAVEEWKEEVRSTRVGGGNRKKKAEKPKRRPAERYTPRAYAQAIERAAIRAKVAHWTPYQLRHYVAGEVDFEHGAEAAQAILGHDKPETTRIYSKRNFREAARVAKEMG